MEFRKYSEEDYALVCKFLIELSHINKNHINWNWARFEWMYEHPEFDKNAKESIGLWICDGKIVSAAIYDMYFGEAFCGVFPEYDYIYPDILDYAYKELRDDSGIGIAICDDDFRKIEMAKKCGFALADQTETIMRIDIKNSYPISLQEGLKYYELDPKEEPYDFQWLLWQGFNHGDDRAEFEKEEKISPQVRKHLNKKLSIAEVNRKCEKVAYCCLWYNENTDYAYVEPVCTIPAYRGKGIASTMIYEALNRVNKLGAKYAYVISEMDFYSNLGFKKDVHFSFYWKK